MSETLLYYSVYILHFYIQLKQLIVATIKLKGRESPLSSSLPPIENFAQHYFIVKVIIKGEIASVSTRESNVRVILLTVLGCNLRLLLTVLGWEPRLVLVKETPLLVYLVLSRDWDLHYRALGDRALERDNLSQRRLKV